CPSLRRTVNNRRYDPAGTAAEEKGTPSMKHTIVGVGMAILVATTAVVSGPVRTLAAGTCTVWTDPANDEQSLIPGQAGPQNDLIQGTMSADMKAETLVVRIH